MEVWDGSKYVNVAEALSGLAGLEGQIGAGEARIQAPEDKVASLDEEKAPLFVAVEPLHLKTDAFPPAVIFRKGPIAFCNSYTPIMGELHRGIWAPRCA